MYDDEDFWDYQVPYSEEYMSFLDNLKGAIKKEVSQEIHDLKAENSKLKKITNDIEDIQKDIDRQRKELERERERDVLSVKRLALEELLEPLQRTYWDIVYTYEKHPKCDKCNENRRIYYLTPLGREESEPCSCDVSRKVFMAKALTLYVVRKKNNALVGYYRFQNVSYEDDGILHYGFSEYQSNTKKADGALISIREDFLNYEPYESIFETEEICNEYCKILQKEEDNDYKEKLNMNSLQEENF